jgi:hypothetical protein
VCVCVRAHVGVCVCVCVCVLFALIRAPNPEVTTCRQEYSIAFPVSADNLEEAVQELRSKNAQAHAAWKVITSVIMCLTVR